jgi:hypothetical protein
MNEPGEKLDFEKADFGTDASGASATAPACAVCRAPITQSYFTANGKIVCGNCREQIVLRPHGFEPSAFVRAAAFGGAVAVLGSVAWYAIAQLTHMEFGLLAIAIGIFVGKAVQRGAGFRSGAIYPALAVALTYCSIVGSYAPLVAAHMKEESSVVAAIVLVLIAPFLGGLQNFLGIVIIGFGLYEAWKFSRVAPIALAGPYELSK